MQMTWIKQPVDGETFSLKAKQYTFLAEQDIAISGWNGQPDLVLRHGKTRYGLAWIVQKPTTASQSSSGCWWPTCAMSRSWWMSRTIPFVHGAWVAPNS